MAPLAIDLRQADAAALQRLLEAAMAPPAHSLAVDSRPEPVIAPMREDSAGLLLRGLRWLYLSFGVSAAAVWHSPYM